jgi:predicted deacylase
MIATITADVTKSAPQVYISGAVHGDERIGPVASTHFIDYLLMNFGKDAYVTKLLKNREIIVTPTTNAWGYHHNK